jgi:outer membrane lipoprotein carrier protein
MFKRLCLLILIALALPAHGRNVSQLKDYYQSVQSLRGEFVQTTKDEAGQVIETARGKVLIERPDRFRWSYSEPFAQEIVADGKQLWVYDVDLEQVTVRPLKDVLGVGPALLLSGDYKTLEQSFAIQPEGDGWFTLVPKRDDWDFQAVRLKMDEGVPQVIEVDGGLGQTTRLELTELQRNAKIDAAQFKFTPPPGVDVIAPKGA